MKTRLIPRLVLIISALFPLSLNATNPESITNQLRKEVAGFFRDQDLSFLQHNVETVRVSFLINAKNQLVIFDVRGDDTDVCDFVKQVLDFKQVTTSKNRQLAKYAVDIRLVKS